MRDLRWRRWMRAGPGRRRGAALLMTICVLGMLLLMVGAFAAITRIERVASTNYVDSERAKFLAWSGVERAKYELRRAPSTPDFPLRWMMYEPGNATPEALPLLEESTEPSFRMFQKDSADKPKALDSATGVVLPWPSGVLGATYYRDADVPAFGGDYYVLKVEDTSAKIALNDGNPALPNMLNTLVQVKTGAPGNAGSKVMTAMPREGYRSVEDLRPVLTAEEFEAVAPYVTVHSFIDRRVIAMGALPPGGSVLPGAPPSARRRQPRAPVNVNAAALPVLTAVFNGIARDSDAIDFAQAKTLAAAVRTRRDDMLRVTGKGFANWGDFYRFLANEAGLTPLEAAAVLANCNPNTDTNKLVPDLSMYRPIDKLDLTAATTELTFAAGGIYEIESLGVVLAPDSENTETLEGSKHCARVIAQSKVRSVVRVFERMVERMQDDFETDRKDPSTAPADAFLRDLTTLPEYRNDRNGNLNDPAEWDGQVTFNVITMQEVSTDGSAAGFIDGTLDGKRMMGGAHPNVGTASGTSGPGTTVLASDLHPFGARTGAGNGGYLAYPQEPDWATNHEVKKTDIVILRDGHTFTLPEDLLATIPGWFYDSVDAQGFELWFKPDHPAATTGSVTAASRRQTLLEWESKGPQDPGAPPPTIPGGGVNLSDAWLAEVHAQNYQNYLDSVDAGGPGPNGEPTVTVSGSGTPLPPPPLSEFFGDPLGTGPLPWNIQPYPGNKFNDAEEYADIADEWFRRKFREIIGDSFEDASETSADGITWGAKARLKIELVQIGDDPIIKTPRFQIEANFVIEQKSEEYESLRPTTTPAAYSRTWTSSPVYAGTWHHVLFSFYALLPPKDASERPPGHTNLYLDASLVPGVPANDNGMWPTEVHAQARIAKRVVDALNESLANGGSIGEGVAIEFNVEDPIYRVPVAIPLGEEPVTVGAALSHDQAFDGLIDNVIFQAKWPKFFRTGAGTGGSPGRYDLWRPSLSRVTTAADDFHLSFLKRTQQLEWDQPIRVVSYAWTAWRHNDQMGGALSLGLV